MSTNKGKSGIVKNAICASQQRFAITSLLILQVLCLGVQLGAKIQQGEHTPEDLGKASAELIEILQLAGSLDDDKKKKKK